MSQGKRTYTKQIITNGSMTGTSVVTSDVVDIRGMNSVGVELVWTGTAVGTFVMQGSISGVTYEDITTNPATISAAGAADNHLINLTDLPFAYFRVRYTNASSTGTLQAYVFCKES